MTTETVHGKTTMFSPQREKAVASLVNILIDDDLQTIERVLVWLGVGIALAVLVLSSRIIATPPPYFVGFALILPAPMWGAFLLTGSGISAWGRFKDDVCHRRDGAHVSMITCGLMLGPLGLKAPGLCCLMLFVLIPQIIVAARLKRECREADSALCE